MLPSEAQSRFARDIQSNQGALAYLESRGLSGFTIDDLGIGFCNFRTYKDLGIELCNRITFPIKSLSGDVIGFGGRVLPGGDGPKYINSAASYVYDKSKVLYNLDIAQDYILVSGSAVVVEGYMDVAALWNIGIRNVVAVCGTALSKWHVRLLKRFSDKIVLMFDGDGAGDKASGRSIEELLPEKHPMYVVDIPFGLDPADWTRNSTREEVLSLIDNAEAKT